MAADALCDTGGDYRQHHLCRLLPRQQLAITAKIDNYFLSKGADNPPLHALTNGVSGGNGVYAYGASSAFPNQTWSAANYWVDVVFQAGLAPTLTSIAVAPTNPSILTEHPSRSRRRGLTRTAARRISRARRRGHRRRPAVATINASGLATAVSAGTTTISAALAGVTNSTVLTVQTPPTLTSIAVTPANPTNLVGATQQFTATGTYSDSSTQNITSQVTWTSSSTGVATINASGLATAVSAGTTTISAGLSGVSGSTFLRSRLRR